MNRTRDREKTRQRSEGSQLLSVSPLARRADLDELLDQGSHPDDELYGTFQDMRRVNHWLGGAEITMRGVQRLTGHLHSGACVQVLDIGVGHADIPRSVDRGLHRRKIRSQVLGIDIDLATLKTGARLLENRDLRFLQGDILHLPINDDAVDIAMCSMTLHHLNDDQAVQALREMARVSRLGIIVNDLTRSLHGYVVAWLLGRIATNNRLTRHDAHRSIRRARTIGEMEVLAADAGLQRPVFDSTLGYRTSMTIGVRPW